MASSRPTVFVCGATGFQGGAVARHLLKLGWGVHAVARDPNSKQAMALSAAGAQLTKGDWDDPESLRSSMAGCTKMFLGLPTTIDDFDRERRQAVSIVDIARKAGVTQVVATTSLGVSLLESLPSDDSGNPTDSDFLRIPIVIKQAVEKTIEGGGFDSVTFIRPGYFMTNFLEPNIQAYSELLSKGTWSTTFRADTRLGLVDHHDTAKVALLAFQNPERLNGRAIGLVSELLTPQETLDTLSEAMGGQGFKAIHLSPEEMASLPEASPLPYVSGHKDLMSLGDLVDMQDLANLIPLTSFKKFLEREDKSIRKL